MDKELYWKRRKEGKRGQGDKLLPNLIEKTRDTYPKMGSHLKKVGTKFILVNRKQSRE